MCVPALSVIMNVCCDRLGAIVGMAVAFKGLRMGMYVEVARSAVG